ncbi:M48 family metallopeptidase [Hyphococcus lacteus]|uniref:M48 family metallopeptidase n=1 Tax=Hyphococcus lacteus TaxID=3143536 RepID=A0ABV3Z1J1_9PROT
MSSEPTLSGRYFDGESGNAQPVEIVLYNDHFLIRSSKKEFRWEYRHTKVAAQPDTETRLSNRHFPDAVLVLPSTGASALKKAAPEIFDGRRERRRITALISGLVIGAGIVTAAVFIGVPAASGPLARATPKDFEMRIGSNLAAQISILYKPCGEADALEILQPVLNSMAEKGDVGFPIEFRFVKSRGPNAFALPGGQVMATSGLLDAIGDDQEAFFAVMAHELGHVRARDGMQAVYRNAGLGITLDIITGGSGAAQQLVLLGGQLNQLRHTRIQEAAADETAIEIMTAMNLDPSALSRAFEAISASAPDEAQSENNEKKYPSWLRSHPNTEKRIENARQHQKSGGKPPLTSEQWQTIVRTCHAAQKGLADKETTQSE